MNAVLNPSVLGGRPAGCVQSAYGVPAPPWQARRVGDDIASRQEHERRDVTARMNHFARALHVHGAAAW